MSPEQVHAEVAERLDAIEREFGVRILYACESGSRAWGFASPDSDYDVRFLYAHKAPWYLSIAVERKRDVIETPLDGLWDINGWDIRKALGLMRRSNPVLFEWLGSPIVYRADEGALGQIRELIPDAYTPLAAWHHYLHMAEGNYREFLKSETVRLKKYLYVLRPVLACRWIEQRSGPIPTPFGELLDATVDDVVLRAVIDDLLVQKMASGEMGTGPRIPAINEFLDAELERMQSTAPPKPPHPIDTRVLDAAFQRLIGYE